MKSVSSPNSTELSQRLLEHIHFCSDHPLRIRPGGIRKSETGDFSESIWGECRIGIDERSVDGVDRVDAAGKTVSIDFEGLLQVMIQAPLSRIQFA